MTSPFRRMIVTSTLGFLTKAAVLLPVAAGFLQAQAPTAPPVETRILAHGDILFISVWREESITGRYTVGTDGKVTMPLVGDVQAAGLSPKLLAGQLTQEFSKFLSKPEVNVAVVHINGKK